MKVWSILAVFVVLVALVSGCCRTPSAEPFTTSLARCVEEDGQMSLEVVVGDVVRIPLAANPTTGYQWVVTVEPTDQVKIVSEEYQAPKAELVGAPGQMVYEFEPLKPGRAELHFAYRRAWEKEVPPAKSFRLILEISSLDVVHASLD